MQEESSMNMEISSKSFDILINPYDLEATMVGGYS